MTKRNTKTTGTSLGGQLRVFSTTLPAHPLPEEEDGEEGEIEVDEEEENLYDEEVDISFSGGEEYDEDVCDDDDAICWVRIRSWYPAQICPEDEIPDAMRRFLPRDRGSEVVVRKFPPFDQEYCVVKISNIRELCENEFDNERSARSGGAMAAYHIALATKKNRNTHVQWNCESQQSLVDLLTSSVFTYCSFVRLHGDISIV